MKLVRLLCLLCAAGAAAPVAAEDVVGQVVDIYVRESVNFFIEARLVRESRGREYWTEVRFAEALADGRTREFVRLPEAVKVERGDLVRAQLAGRPDGFPGLIPEVNRMVALVARRDSLAAITFGARKPQAPSAFLQAAVQ